MKTFFRKTYTGQELFIDNERKPDIYEIRANDNTQQIVGWLYCDIDDMTEHVIDNGGDYVESEERSYRLNKDAIEILIEENKYDILHCIMEERAANI